MTPPVSRSPRPLRDVIVALDVDTSDRAKFLVDRLGDVVTFYKVAPSMTMKDPRFIPWLVKQGKKVFLDCKWYDIPSQVERSVRAAGEMGVTAVTVHAGGGSAMLKSALAARSRPMVWGVTVLTSFGTEDLREVGVPVTPATQVLRLARLAQKVGLDGLVCSPREAGLLRTSGVHLTLITPGIQFGAIAGKDQKRTAGPAEAWAAGANYLVVGRSVLEAKNPALAARSILQVRETL